MGRHARVLVVALAVLVSDAPDEASARARREGRRVERHAELARRRPEPVSSIRENPPVDRAVACSCTSATSCPAIGALTVKGYRPQPLYCNQWNGATNPGLRTADTWYYQCTEIANRWLMESVGAPRIVGNAEQMCDNADRSAFDVHRRGSAYEPVPGDLLVWGGYTMGHVGVVTAVSASAVVFANQNYGHNGWQYPVLAAPRAGGFFGNPRGDKGLYAKCIVHPRKLPASPGSPTPSAPAPAPGPCARVAPANDGTYCGASRQSGFAGGDEHALYTCHNGRTSSRRCASGCVLEPAGRPDHCQ